MGNQFTSLVQVLLLLASLFSIWVPLEAVNNQEEYREAGESQDVALGRDSSPGGVSVVFAYRQALKRAKGTKRRLSLNKCLSVCKDLLLIAVNPSSSCSFGSKQTVSDGRVLWDFVDLLAGGIQSSLKGHSQTHESNSRSSHQLCCCKEVQEFLMMQQLKTSALTPNYGENGCVLMKRALHSARGAPHAMIVLQDGVVFPVLCRSTSSPLGSQFNGSDGIPPEDDFLREIHRWVDSTIQTHDVVVFAKTACPYCVEAVELLQAYEVADLRVEYLDETPRISHYVQDYLESITGSRSVPRIFIFGRSVGGCDDLMKLHESDKLSKMLRKSA